MSLPRDSERPGLSFTLAFGGVWVQDLGSRVKGSYDFYSANCIWRDGERNTATTMLFRDVPGSGQYGMSPNISGLRRAGIRLDAGVYQGYAREWKRKLILNPTILF